jgi:hypothetical protein
MTLLIVNTFLPLVSSAEKKDSYFDSLPEDELDQYQDSNCGWGALIYRNWYYAQEFSPSLNILTKVELLLYKDGNIDLYYDKEIKVTIRHSLDGEDLTSAFIRIDEIKNNNWNTFDFQDICVNTNDIYYMICSCRYGGDSENYIGWSFGNNNPYPSGNTKRSDNYGNDWDDINWTHLDFYDIDFCFATYGYNDPSAHEDLKCYADLTWSDISPNKIIETNISIENCGFFGSCLDWKITEYPEWGTWEFEIMDGEDLISGTIEIINIEITAPNEKNMEFNGQLKIINQNNPDDYEIIPVTLITPKSKPINEFNSWIFRLIERFPILEKLMI